MGILRLKIDILKSYLDREIMLSGYIFTKRIVRISQMLDEYIVRYEAEKIRRRA